MKNVKRINESQLKAIVAESVRNVLNEISFSSYDNPQIRRGYLDGDEFSSDGVEYTPSINPEFDAEEDRYNKVLELKHKGLLTQSEFDAIAEKMGW